MNKPIRGSIADARLLTLQQACVYTGMGQNNFRKWADSIGATRKFGAAVRFDKVVIDKILDAMNRETAEE